MMWYGPHAFLDFPECVSHFAKPDSLPKLFVNVGVPSLMSVRLFFCVAVISLVPEEFV